MPEGRDDTSQSIFVRELLLRVEGDRALAERMATLFLEVSPSMLEAIRTALAAGDAAGLARAAHGLKGSASNFPAREAVDAALELEKLGQRGALALAPEALTRLEQQVQRLTERLQTFVRPGALKPSAS